MRSLGALATTHGNSGLSMLATPAGSTLLDFSGQGGIRGLLDLTGGPETVVTIAEAVNLTSRGKPAFRSTSLVR